MNAMIANVRNGTKYDSWRSYMNPANRGAKIISTLFGTCDSPIIVANAFRPK